MSDDDRQLGLFDDREPPIMRPKATRAKKSAKIDAAPCHLRAVPDVPKPVGEYPERDPRQDERDEGGWELHKRMMKAGGWTDPALVRFDSLRWKRAFRQLDALEAKERAMRSCGDDGGAAA